MEIIPLLLLFLFFSTIPGMSMGQGWGINYGQIADDLPHPTQVASLLRTIAIKRVKLYDADPQVLSAFRGTDVEFIVAIDNGKVAEVMDPAKARDWILQNIQPYLPHTRISSITVGNEVFSGDDPALMNNLLPAMQSVHAALSELGLEKQVNVSTAHSFSILASSFPPSSGAFRGELTQYLLPLLEFHRQIKSPFLINSYPFFAYKADPGSISLDYVLFRPNPGVRDPSTGLVYDNMLYAQMDAAYSAVKAVGFEDIDIRISETGWPSKGDEDEIGASVENAGVYNRNLLERIRRREGTPMKPGVPVDVFVFALFNENLKPGPTSERNYGLFYPDGTPVYSLGVLQGYSQEYFFSSSPSSMRRAKAAVVSMVLLLALLL